MIPFFPPQAVRRLDGGRLRRNGVYELPALRKLPAYLAAAAALAFAALARQPLVPVTLLIFVLR